MATPAALDTLHQIYAQDDLAQPPRTVPDPKKLTKFVRTRSQKSIKNGPEARSSGSSRVSSALRVRQTRLGEDSKRKPRPHKAEKATSKDSKEGSNPRRKPGAQQKSCMRVNSKQLLIKQQTLHALNKERRSHQALEADLEHTHVYSSHEFYPPGFTAQSPSGESNERLPKPSIRSEAHKFDKKRSQLKRTNTDQVNIKGSRKKEFIKKIEQVKSDIQTQMKTLSSKLSNKENLARDHSSSKAERRSRSRDRSSSKPRKMGTHLAHVQEEDDADKVEFYPVPSGSFTSKPGLVDALFNNPPMDYPQIRSSRLVTGESPIDCTRSKSVISGSCPNCQNPRCMELVAAYEEALNNINNHAEQLTVEKGEFEVLYQHTLAQYKQQLQVNERLQDSSRKNTLDQDFEYWKKMAEDLDQRTNVQKKEILLWENKYQTLLQVNKELNKTLDQLEQECIIVSERFHQLQQQQQNKMTIPTQSSEEKGSLLDQQPPQPRAAPPNNERFITFQQTQVSLPAGGTEQCSRGDFLSTQQSRNQGPHYLSIDERKRGTGCWLPESQDLAIKQYNAAKLAAEKQQRDKVAFALQQLSFQRSNSSNSFEIGGHRRTPVCSDNTSQSPAPRHPAGGGSLKRAPSSQGRNLLQSEYQKYQESVHKNLLKRTSSAGSTFKAAYNFVHCDPQQSFESNPKRNFNNLRSLRSKSNQQPSSIGLQVSFKQPGEHIVHGRKRIPEKLPKDHFRRQPDMNKTYSYHLLDNSESVQKRQDLYASLERVFQREKQWQQSMKQKIITNSQQPITLKNQRSKSPSLHSQDARPPLQHERAPRRKSKIEPEVEYGVHSTNRMIADNISYQKRSAMEQLETIYKQKVRQHQISLASIPKQQPTVAEAAGIELNDLEKMADTQLNQSIVVEPSSTIRVSEMKPAYPSRPTASGGMGSSLPIDEAKYLSNEWINTKVEGFMKFSQKQKEVLDSQQSKKSLHPEKSRKNSSQASLSAYASAFDSAKASLVVLRASEAIPASENKLAVLQAATSADMQTESRMEPQTSPTDYILPGKGQFFNIQEGSSHEQQQSIEQLQAARPMVDLNLAQIQGGLLPNTQHQSRQVSSNLNPQQQVKPHFQSQKHPVAPLASSGAQLMVVDEQVEVYANIPGMAQTKGGGKKKLGKQLSQQLHGCLKMGESEQSTDNEGKDGTLDDRLKKLKTEMEVMTAHLNQISVSGSEKEKALESDEAAVTFLNKEDFNFGQNQSSVQHLDHIDHIEQLGQLGYGQISNGQLGKMNLEQLGKMMSSEHIGSGVFSANLARAVCITSPNQKLSGREGQGPQISSGVVGEGLIQEQAHHGITSPTLNPQAELIGGHSLCSFAEPSKETELTEVKKGDDEFSDTAAG